MDQDKEELAARPVRSLEEDPGEINNRMRSEDLQLSILQGSMTGILLKVEEALFSKVILIC